MKLFFSLFTQGIKPEGSEHDYERTSNVYKDLVTLLKSRSPYFAENIKTQVSNIYSLIAPFHSLDFHLSQHRCRRFEILLCPTNKVLLLTVDLITDAVWLMCVNRVRIVQSVSVLFHASELVSGCHYVEKFLIQHPNTSPTSPSRTHRQTHAHFQT